MYTYIYINIYKNVRSIDCDLRKIKKRKYCNKIKTFFDDWNYIFTPFKNRNLIKSR